MRPAVLYPEPITPPFACTKCGAHGNVREWFVDIGAEVEWEGIVYICDACMETIVKVTPNYMSVESHRQIVAEYTKELDRLADLDTKIAKMSAVWMDLTGNSLDIFFDNLEKAKEYDRSELGLPESLPESVDTESTIDRDSFESEPSDSSTDGTEPTSLTDLIFTQPS